MASGFKGLLESLEQDIAYLNDDSENDDLDDYKQNNECKLDCNIKNYEQNIDNLQFFENAQLGERNMLQEITEEMDESQFSNQNQQNLIHQFNFNYELPILIIEENSNLSHNQKIKLTGFSNYLKNQQQEKAIIENQFQKCVQEKGKELMNQQQMTALSHAVRLNALQEKISSLQKAQNLFDQKDNSKSKVRNNKIVKHIGNIQDQKNEIADLEIKLNQ